MPRIHQLSTSVINKIAAGEVIERPGSVVKELLENSVDALASRIDVDIGAGGTELIRIVDDGEGIHPDDLPLAISSHATSKIENADDLFGVQTMGFRGEALASVAEVSRLRIRSRQADQPHGRELVVNLGEVIAPRECGCPQGTQIEVRNLFENTPVRRKFLKTVSTEFGHISEQFTRVALANPRLHMVLRHNDKLVMEVPAAANPLDRLQLFFGDDIADELIPVESTVAGVRIWGYVGHPNTSKSTRKMQYLFLNGRWITDRSLQHALTEAYRGLLMVGRQPVAFLYLEVPSDRVDVNVHPTKVEVRFQDGQQLFRQLLAMIRTKFLSMDLNSQLRLPVGSSPQSVGTLSGFAPSPSRPMDGRSERQAEFAGFALDRISGGDQGLRAAGVNTLPLPAFANQTAVAEASWPPVPMVKDQLSVPRPSPPDFDQAPAQQLDRQSASMDARSDSADVLTVNEPQHESVETSRVIQFRAMQVHDCYLIVETTEGVTVIDQHALHERIMYEHLRSRVLSGTVESQRLLVPQPVEVTAKEAALLLEQSASLEQAGLGIEDFGNGTLIVTRYPAMLKRVDLRELVRDLVQTLESGGTVQVESSARRDILDELLHMMSCKAAIKAGQRLSQDEIDSLLRQRHLVDDAHHCPHGRPTALSLTRTELDRQFGRLG